jgi:hypothetical protein
MDNSPVSYSGGPGFKSQPGSRLCYLRYFDPFRKIRDRTSNRTIAAYIRNLSDSFVTDHPIIGCHHKGR